MTTEFRRKKWDEIEQMGQRIREARERRGLTQEALGQLIGRNQHAISHYESGTRAIVVTELPAIAKALQVPIEYFFGNVVDPDEEALGLVSELSTLPPGQRKTIVERWRLELEWWKKHE